MEFLSILYKFEKYRIKYFYSKNNMPASNPGKMRLEHIFWGLRTNSMFDFV